MTREETKIVVNLLSDMYSPLLTGKVENDKNIINIWWASLQHYTLEQVQYAITQLANRKIYGKVQLADIKELIDPTPQFENKGIEFASRVIELLPKGTDNMEDTILKEFGNTGHRIYLMFKKELRELKTSDINTFKAQLRDVYNSKYESEQIKNIQLSNGIVPKNINFINPNKQK